MDICNRIVPEQGRIVTTTASMIVIFKTDARRARTITSNIPYPNVFNIAATVEVRFKVNSTITRMDKHIFHVNIAYTCRHLAADAKTVCFRPEGTVANDNVFCRTANAPCILVPASLDGDSIVPNGKVTVFNQYI